MAVVKFEFTVDYPHISDTEDGDRDMESQVQELRKWFGERGGTTQHDTSTYAIEEDETAGVEE